jgi:hypothetical protein
VLIAAAGPHFHHVGFSPADEEAAAVIVYLLQLAPLAAGLFLGAPLLAGEAEHGTMRFVWTQVAGRRRWLLAQVVPVAVALGLAGVGLGLIFRWSVVPALGTSTSWNGRVFPLNPLPFAGWLVFGFSLGVAIGAVVRQLLPAIAATLTGYLTTLVLAGTGRNYYLPPGTEPLAHSSVSTDSYAFGVPGTIDKLSDWLGWPSGRRLPAADESKPTPWFAAHHIKVWITYQPASRFGTFELIEFGWLIAASAALIAVALVLVSRRSA